MSLKNNKSLGINAILNGLQSVLNLIFPLITFPYVSRILSVDGMGIYNFSNTYVGYFLLIAGLGINTTDFSRELRLLPAVIEHYRLHFTAGQL